MDITSEIIQDLAYRLRELEDREKIPFVAESPPTPPPMAGGGIEVEGTETLYYVPVLREYDENGDIVAIGDESDPLDTGHTLKPTWDLVRAI